MKMRGNRALRVFAVSAIFAVLGCNSESDLAPSPSASLSKPSGSSHTSSPVDSPWSLLLINHCDGVPDGRCAGAYGFSVGNTGDFVVGPGPSGERLSGSLTSQELLSLTETLSRAGSSAKECGKGASVFLNRVPFCDNERSLHDALYRLATRYSPAEFPNPCIDAGMALDTLYESMRRCDQDSDCVYVGDDFLPLREDSGDEVVTDDCTYLRPMLVGNSFLAVTNQLELLMKRDIARKVCGSELARTSCGDPQTIDVRQGAPSCVDGVCRLERFK
jgi:hypothetical protein